MNRKSTGILDVYEPQYDAETLKRAEEIMSDRKRHAAAKSHAAKQAATYGKIAGTVTKAPIRHRSKS
jgi:hypothetical protein